MRYYIISEALLASLSVGDTHSIVDAADRAKGFARRDGEAYAVVLPVASEGSFDASEEPSEVELPF